MIPTVPEADLGVLTRLGIGGFAEVFRVDGYLLPGDATPLAYKRFIKDHAEQVRAGRASAEFRESLSATELGVLDRMTVWPRALVADGSGKICGLLMALIPQEFFCRKMNDSGKMISAPRQLEWLISTAEQRATAQIDLRDAEFTERLAILARLVYILGWLHKRGWVFGDLSFGNVTFALDPPRVMLLDCDGAAALTDLKRRPVSTLGWDPPECPAKLPPGSGPLQDDVSDVYKLGLAILRCLNPGKGAGSTKAPTRLTGRLDGEGVDLVTRALSDIRADRPTARQLYGYLRRTVAGRTAPPDVTHARLVTPLRVRGQDARIEWRIAYATEIEIRVGYAPPITLSPADRPHGHVFRPAESGQVVIEARNRYASVTVELGELTLYELPEFDLSRLRLPRVHIPPTPALSVPSLSLPGLSLLSRIAEGRPRPMAEMTRMPSLNVSGFVDGLVPVKQASVPFPRIGEAVNDVSDVVRGSIASVASEITPALWRAYMTTISSGGAGS